MNSAISGGHRGGSAAWALLIAAGLLAGCQDETPLIDGPISAYRDRMLVQQASETKPREVPPVIRKREPVAQPVPAQADQPQRTALMTGPTTTTQPAPADVLIEIPDPTEAPQVWQARVDELRGAWERQAEEARARGRAAPERRHVDQYERVVRQANEYLAMGRLPTQVPLSLSETIQRAIEHNYTIRIEAHNPAISQTQIVEAEAAFDAVFFLNTSLAELDQDILPSVPPGSGQTSTRSFTGGFRKLLPTGMVATVGPSITRQWSGAPQGPIKSWNPVWNSTFVADIRQPLLRGFGLDINRAQINLARVEYRISQEQFLQNVRDTLLDVETAYWSLVQTRRRLAVLAEETAQNLITFENMKARLILDATEIEVSNARSRWQSQLVTYLEAIKNVREAEDQLKLLMNDPAFKLSEAIEMVPTDVPLAASLVLDHFAEVRTALERRSEIHQARERINQARIGTAIAKNRILPQLDLTFQYEVDGLGPSADDAFDRVTTNRYISYTVGVTFAYELGERAGRAQERRAQLQESAAVLALQQTMDVVVTEVNDSIRALRVRYEQVPPSLDSVQAAASNLIALQARTTTINPPFLQTELAAVQQLATTRTLLLDVLVGYNLEIVRLERAKGTLLEYNNVAVVPAQPPGR
ncbi:MAG: TolC family protein [Planctomycetota bacterium]